MSMVTGQYVMSILSVYYVSVVIAAWEFGQYDRCVWSVRHVSVDSMPCEYGHCHECCQYII